MIECVFFFILRHKSPPPLPPLAPSLTLVSTSIEPTPPFCRNIVLLPAITPASAVFCFCFCLYLLFFHAPAPMKVPFLPSLDDFVCFWFWHAIVYLPFPAEAFTGTLPVLYSSLFISLFYPRYNFFSTINSTRFFKNHPVFLLFLFFSFKYRLVLQLSPYFRFVVARTTIIECNQFSCTIDNSRTSPPFPLFFQSP